MTVWFILRERARPENRYLPDCLVDMDGIYGELRILLSSFVLGIFLTLAYDLLRVGRKVFKTGWIRTGIEDILFWLLAAVCFALMCLKENDGNVRWYMGAAALAGGYLCLLLEKLAGICCKTVIKWLQRRKKSSTIK